MIWTVLLPLMICSILWLKSSRIANLEEAESHWLIWFCQKLIGNCEYDMGSHMSTIDVGWGSPTFHKMGREKVILIDSILPYGFELLMCDTDMVWLKNPLPFLARYPEADVLTSSDQVVPTVADDRLDIWQQV